MNRQTNLILKLTSLLALTQLSLACGNQQKTSGVTTTITVTGSAQTATVAQNSVEKWLNKAFDFFMPGAIAHAPPSLMDSQGSTVVLSEGWVVVDSIEFASTELPGQADEQEVEFYGTHVIDLFANSPMPLATVELPFTDVRRIRLKLHRTENSILPAGAPAGLEDQSIFFAGTVNGVGFTYQSQDTANLEIGGPNAVLPSETSGLLVSFQIANLFKQIDFSAITSATQITAANRVPGANLCPSIDASANDLYTCIRKGLEKHSDVGCDDDGDDEIDSDEDSVK